MPTDEVLTAELATVRYSYTSSGKLKVETKDEMKKRGLRSCDLADAFVLTFAGASQARWGAGMSRTHSERPRPTHANSRYSPHRWHG